MARLQDVSVAADMPPNAIARTSTVPTNATPIGGNPFCRIHTPIARLGANVNVPTGQPWGNRR